MPPHQPPPCPILPVSGKGSQAEPLPLSAGAPSICYDCTEVEKEKLDVFQFVSDILPLNVFLRISNYEKTIISKK
jgi:hypothetical protein